MTSNFMSECSRLFAEHCKTLKPTAAPSEFELFAAGYEAAKRLQSPRLTVERPNDRCINCGGTRYMCVACAGVNTHETLPHIPQPESDTRAAYERWMDEPWDETDNRKDQLWLAFKAGATSRPAPETPVTHRCWECGEPAVQTVEGGAGVCAKHTPKAGAPKSRSAPDLHDWGDSE